MKRLFAKVVVAVLVVPVAVVLASKRQVIDSHWRDRDVVIDGDNGEWPGPLVAVEENHPLLTAAMNDGQYLYVVLSTNDARVRGQIFRQGLVVWFDPSGGDKKHFGVKYPVGVPFEQAGGRGGYRRGGYGGGRPPSDSGSSDPTHSTPSDPEPIDRLEVYGPQKDDAHSFVTTMAPGIAVKTGNVEGYAVYELKVPLAKTADAPYAIEAKPGAVIGFGLETPKVEQPSREGHGGGGFGGMGGGMGGRGGGGMGGHGGGGGRGGGERGGYEAPKPLKMWAAIKLATNQ
jgi:hypothetical protein